MVKSFVSNLVYIYPIIKLHYTNPMTMYLLIMLKPPAADTGGNHVTSLQIT